MDQEQVRDTWIDAMRERVFYAKQAVSATVLVIAAGLLGGCQTASLSDVTGALGSQPSRHAAADPQEALELHGARYRANPKDPEAALRFGNALRAAGQREQAVAVLEHATLVNPGNRTLLASYGRALADAGRSQQAFDILTRAHTPDNPDWRILSVQGTTLDQLGRHEEARRYYASALKLRPEEPSVLSNLGLSYMLTKELPQAEATLRRAYAGANPDPRVRQNLGLVVGLQGRFAEAATIVKSDLPPEEATANVAYLREMLNRKDGPRLGDRGRSNEPDRS